MTSPNGNVAAATAAGRFVWSFDPRALGIANPTLVTAGPRLLAYGEGRVTVIDRTGAVVGHGAMGQKQRLLPGPTGMRWAWTTQDAQSVAGPSGPTSQVNSLWLAGVGQSPHKVRSWTGDYDVEGVQWSDAGVVILKLTTTCGRDPHSSELVDPATGAETPLFGAGRWPLDVAAGVHVAMAANSSTLYLEGAAQLTRAYPLPIHVARVDPSGSRVFVSTFGMEGCGGRPAAATSIVALPSGAQTTIDGFFADAWLDDAHLLGRSVAGHTSEDFTWSAHVQLADMAGHRSDVALGRLVGVLRP